MGAAQARAQSEAQNQQFAATLVNRVLHAKAGDLVVIYGDATTNMALVEDITTQLRRIGAFGIADLGSNRENKLYFQYVPAKYDSQAPKDAFALARIATALVTIDYPADPSVTQGVSAARQSAINNANVPFTVYVLKHNVPGIDIGNGLMPSAMTAAQFGVPVSQLSILFWSGVNADYAQIHRDALRMSAASNGSHLVRVTAANGTNVTFRTLAGSAVVNDGTISAANRAKGGAALQKQLPAGDVYFLPSPGSVNGTIVFGDTRYQGSLVCAMSVHFKNGKVTSMTARTGLDAVRKLYGSGGAGRDELGWADFGVNRAMRVGPGQWGNGPSMAAGYVTLALGNNLTQGGSNRSAFFFASNIPGATVNVAGQNVVLNGRLSPSFETLTMTNH